ncbi:hypothetical protein D3C73_845360 [compost metagenome]
MRSLSFRDQLRGQPFHRNTGRSLGDIILNEEVAGQHPHHIAVYRRFRPVEGNAEDGACCVRTHPLEAKHGVTVIGHLSAILLFHLLGCMLQVPGPGIVAESLPALQHLLLGGISQ